MKYPDSTVRQQLAHKLRLPETRIHVRRKMSRDCDVLMCCFRSVAFSAQQAANGDFLFNFRDNIMPAHSLSLLDFYA